MTIGLVVVTLLAMDPVVERHAVVLASVKDAAAAEAMLEGIELPAGLTAVAGYPRTFAPDELLGLAGRKPVVVAGFCATADGAKRVVKAYKKKFPQAKTVAVWGPWAGTCPEPGTEPKLVKSALLAPLLKDYEAQLAATQQDPTDENLVKLWLLARRFSTDHEAELKKLNLSFTSAFVHQAEAQGQAVGGLDFHMIIFRVPAFFWATAAVNGRKEAAALFSVLASQHAGWMDSVATSSCTNVGKGFFARALARLDATPATGPLALVVEEERRQILGLFADKPCLCFEGGGLAGEAEVAAQQKQTASVVAMGKALEALKAAGYREPSECAEARRPDGD